MKQRDANERMQRQINRYKKNITTRKLDDKKNMKQNERKIHLNASCCILIICCLRSRGAHTCMITIHKSHGYFCRVPDLFFRGRVLVSLAVFTLLKTLNNFARKISETTTTAFFFCSRLRLSPEKRMCSAIEISLTRQMTTRTVKWYYIYEFMCACINAKGKCEQLRRAKTSDAHDFKMENCLR